ncbi:hypothetical protein INT48_006470 [Thamnidium elegans]|uniref:Uncharacterized protein n=1 Tax=Thamnidium elegans TaxID=101142 RepID=A0A8H7VZ29_9FUNG|nr:hypothetical protein INT48_006470 [Thamnidium elegans]
MNSLNLPDTGEKSAGYLKLTVQQDQSQRFIPSLQHPDDLSLLYNTPTTLASAATSFYKNLFASEPVNNESIQFLFVTIPGTDKITTH